MNEAELQLRMKKDEPLSLDPPIPVSEAYQIIEQQLREHTRHLHILSSKKINRAKFPSDEPRKDFAGSVYWKEPRRLRSDHWMEFLIFGKPLAQKIYARASDWQHELKHEKLVLEKIWEAVQVAFGKFKVKIETD